MISCKCYCMSYKNKIFRWIVRLTVILQDGAGDDVELMIELVGFIVMAKGCRDGFVVGFLAIGLFDGKSLGRLDCGPISFKLGIRVDSSVGAFEGAAVGLLTTGWFDGDSLGCLEALFVGLLLLRKPVGD